MMLTPKAVMKIPLFKLTTQHFICTLFESNKSHIRNFP